MERAKECRGIKREQKDRRNLSLLSSPSLFIGPSRAILSSPVVLRPHARGARDRYIRAHPLSAVLVRFSPLLASSVSFLLDKSPRLFVTHRVSFSSFNQALPSIRPLLFRSHARKMVRRMTAKEKERERGEAQTFSECGPRESVSIVRYLCFITFN